MYIESKELLNTIADISCKVQAATGGMVEFEEYIALPFYGNIILRFNLVDKSCTIDQLDTYEHIINTIVGQDFLSNFMGSVYQRVGVDYTKQDKIFDCFITKYSNETIIESKYADLIKSDAKEILKLCGFDTDLNVWEIQYEDEVGVYILGQKSAKLKIVEFDKKYCFYEVDKDKCEALIKAAFYAKRKGVSLGRLMLAEQ